MSKKLMMLFAVLAVGAVAAVAGVGALASNSAPIIHAPASAPDSSTAADPAQKTDGNTEAPDASTEAPDKAQAAGAATGSEAEGEQAGEN